MTNSISTPVENFRQLFAQIQREVDHLIDCQKQNLSIISEDGNISVEISGDCSIISIDLADAIFSLDKFSFEISMVQAINSAILELWINIKGEMYLSNISIIAKNFPGEVLSHLLEYQKSVAEELIASSKIVAIYPSKNQKISFSVMGGVKFISMDIQSDLFIPSMKDEIVNEIILTVNHIMANSREKSKLMSTKIRRDLFLE
jgi:DNA-binding protein YbaB